MVWLGDLHKLRISISNALNWAKPFLPWHYKPDSSSSAQQPIWKLSSGKWPSRPKLIWPRFGLVWREYQPRVIKFAGMQAHYTSLIFSSIFSCNSQEIRFSGEAFIGIKCSLFSSMVPQDSLWTLFIPMDLLGYFSWHPNTLWKRPSILANDPWDPWPKSHCLSRDDMSLSSRSLQWWMWCSVVSTNFSRKASMIISVQAPVILPSCVCLNNELYLSRFFSGAQKATCTLHTTEHGPHSRCWLPRLVAWKVIRNNGTIQILIIK